MKTINGTVMDMVTVGEYQPIAGLGLNTIRKMKPKYADLAIGDEVEMIYQYQSDAVTVMNGVERLKVKSLAMIPFCALMDSLHVEMNHSGLNNEELLDKMLEFYGEFDTTDDFLVIYFD